MSYTEIYGFDKNGEAYFEGEVRNAFRGAMAIWKTLEEKYLPPYQSHYMKMLGLTLEQHESRFGYRPSRCTEINDGSVKEIWNLVNNSDVSITDKICLSTTFDGCLVKKENLPTVIKAFRAFEGKTSLKEQADILESMFEDEGCIAAGWNQTSVNCDTWSNKGGYDEENDESIPYNCLTMTDHYWLGEEIREWNRGSEDEKEA